MELRHGATLDFSAVSLVPSKRKMYSAIVAAAPGTWVPAVHANCWHNEVAALVKRSLGPTPGSDEEARLPVLREFRLLRRMASRYCGQRWDYLETAQSYTGALRRRYLEARESLLLDGPVRPSDLRLRAFLKAEKRDVESLAKPRMIFPRSPRYNLHLASWLKPFEHWLWGNLKSRVVSGVGNSRVVAKGLNMVQRANLILRKMREIPDCVVFEVDGKAFEAHVETWQLRQEHSVYLSAYPGDGELAAALNGQLVNRGVTLHGVRFSRDGGRASGDFNTGMGNSLVMLAVVMAVMRVLHVRVWDTLVDGDNALLFLPANDCDRVRGEFGAVATRISGHEMVLESPTSVPEKVRFGQSAPVRCEGGWKMVRDWRKVLSQCASSHIHLREPHFAREFLYGVSLCESSLAHGVPILWAFCSRLQALTRLDRKPRLHPLADYRALGVDLDALVPVEPREPDLDARRSFELAYGVSPSDQVRIERRLRSVKVCYHDFVSEVVDDAYRFLFECN